MAGNLSIIDPVTQTNLATFAIGSGTAVTGVWYDGVYFWVTNQLSCLQLYIDNQGTLRTVNSFKIDTVTPDFSEADCICGDGLNLYIAYTAVVGGGPTALKYNIGQYTKDGQLLRVLSAGNLGSVLGPWLDITFNGFHLIGVRSTASGTPTHPMNFIDVTADRRVDTGSSTDRAVNMIAAYGYDRLWSGASTNINMVDYEKRPITPAVSIGVTGEAICVISSDNDITHQNQNPFLKNLLYHTDGVLLGVVSN